MTGMLDEREVDATVRAVADDLFRITRELVYAMVELEFAAKRDDAALRSQGETLEP